MNLVTMVFLVNLILENLVILVNIVNLVNIVILVILVREAPPKKNVYIWALPKLQFDPPYCANPGTLWHNYFAENEKIL